MAGSPPNFHKMDSRSACIQDVLKVKVKVKGHVIRALSWILGMSYSVIDGLVLIFTFIKFRPKIKFIKFELHEYAFINAQKPHYRAPPTDTSFAPHTRL